MNLAVRTCPKLSGHSTTTFDDIAETLAKAKTLIPSMDESSSEECGVGMAVKYQILAASF